MTREEAIFCEKSYIGETDCADCKYYGTDTCQSRESHKMAIKALEQEPMLDKIKGYVDHIRNTGMGKKKSLEFIEKFIERLKGESEG